MDSATRRAFIERAVGLGIGATVLAALPHARATSAPAAEPSSTDGTLQAFADTILPGRRAARTELGNEIHPQAIAGVDSTAGAVETDALLLYHHPRIGFDTLAPAFLASLETFALAEGGPFLSLPFARRTEVCVAGLSFDNPERVVWEAAAAVPFTAFCAAAVNPAQTADKAGGYRVMGLPGRAPAGYADFSYRRRLARERTRKGYLA